MQLESVIKRTKAQTTKSHKRKTPASLGDFKKHFQGMECARDKETGESNREV
jgi:hypothetical protein